MKKKILNFIIFVVGIFLLAITFNVFVLPHDYMVGGMSGIAVLMNYLFNMDVSLVLLIGNLLLILIGILVLGLKNTSASIVGSLFYTVAVYLTENINSVLNIAVTNEILNLLVVGLLFGFSCAIIYLAGYTSGGVDVLGMILYKKTGLPLGKSLLIINALLIILGTIFMGFEMLIIALLIRFIESKVIDYFLLGISDSKVMFINTNKQEDVKKYIINELNSGISEIKITSGYKKFSDKLLMCVVPTEKCLILKKKIIEQDSKAFITILDAYEVYGGTNRYKLPLHDYRI